MARVVTDDSTQAQLPLGGKSKPEANSSNGPNGG
jgi:hypothetical protein